MSTIFLASWASPGEYDAFRDDPCIENKYDLAEPRAVAFIDYDKGLARCKRDAVAENEEELDDMEKSCGDHVGWRTLCAWSLSKTETGNSRETWEYRYNNGDVLIVLIVRQTKEYV